MDTVTQIALGAAVGEAVLGRQVGRRAALWGGLCGLFPDLDVLVPLGDAVKDFTYHRGPSHSLFVLAALTPLFVFFILKFHPWTARLRLRWHAMVYAAFVTHVLLDCLTVYGTQILWPLPTPPVMWSTIFIIDPAYSIPLFFGVLTAVVLSRNARLGHGINTACLILTTGYLVWSIGAKVHVNGVAREALERQNVSFDRILTVPTPFNTLLWRVLVMEGSAYREGFYSLLDQGREIRFKQYPSEHNLLDGLESHWPVKRLKWFTHGFFSARQFGSGVVMTDLRMGIEPSYVFSFKVGRVANPHALPTESERVYGQRKWEQLQWVWKRIWTTEPQVADNGLDVASKAGADALTRQR